jgi:nucleotide-binding universal stress UspA family protein
VDDECREAGAVGSNSAGRGNSNHHERIIMYKHILLPVDGSELSLKAVNECFGFAKAVGAKITIINVVPHFSLQVDTAFASDLVKQIEKSREDEYRKVGEKMVGELAQRAKKDGIQCESAVVVGNSPYEEIIVNADKRGCDLITMASHGRRGLDAVLLGSETMKVLTHTKIPVLVVR